MLIGSTGALVTIAANLLATTSAALNQALLWTLGAVGLVVLVAVVSIWLARRPRGPCAELRERCRQLREEAAGTSRRAALARFTADSAVRAAESARKAREAAQQRVDAAADPQSGSQGEGLNAHDLTLQREYEADVRAQLNRGEITAEEAREALSHWDDPELWQRLRRQGMDRAVAELEAARATESADAADAERATSEAMAAEAGAATAERAAEAACQAAAECAGEKGGPPPPKPTAQALPTTAPPASATPSSPDPTPLQDDCAEGETRTETRGQSEVDLYQLAGIHLEINGAYLSDQPSIDQTLTALTGATWVIDMAPIAGEVVSGAPLAIGAWITARMGFPNFDTITSLPEEAAFDDLRRLIDRMRNLQQWGDWTLRCPQVRARVHCEITHACQRGAWTIVSRNLVVEAVGQPGMAAAPTEAVLSWEEGQRAVTRMANHFRANGKAGQLHLEECAKRGAT